MGEHYCYMRPHSANNDDDECHDASNVHIFTFYDFESIHSYGGTHVPDVQDVKM